MASREQLERQRELNRLERERAGISDAMANDIRQTSNVIKEQTRFLGLERTEKEEIRKLNREINQLARDNFDISLSELANQKTLSKLASDREKVDKKITRLNKLSRDLAKEQSKAAKELSLTLSEQVDDLTLFKKELSGIERVAKDVQEATGVKAFAGVAEFIKSIPGLSQFAKPFEEASDSIKNIAVDLERQRKDLEFMFDTGTGLNKEKLKELGLLEKIGKYYGTEARDRIKALGLDKEIIEQLELKGDIQKRVNEITANFGKTILGGIVLTNLFAINKAQAEFRREVGRGVDIVDTLNDRLISATDFVRTATELTRQFGFNATAVFSNENLSAASELTNLMGLTAGQAANFALFSQTTGTSLDQNQELIIDQVGALNVANKSAVTQAQIFRDIGETSSAISLTFQGNTIEIARAAQQARILGITLQQVDNIAAGLLDIESSIAKEFEAEVISGQQLNLERARFYALTNDLEGVTRELANNQEAISSFASGTRIQQEAIAGALGMSRDEMADMIFQQRLQLGITDEQAAATLGLNKADFQRLAAQESISKSIEKIGSSLAVVVEPVLGFIAQHTDKILGLFTVLAGISLVSLGKQLVALLPGLIGIAGVTSGPLGIAGIIGGIAAASLLTSELLFKNAGDAIIPAGRGPIISTREGGLIQGTANDDIIMAPGVARGRNAGLSSSDINAIAKAVRDGASQAQINLDGGRVSNRLQPSLAVNTRKYSI